MWTRHQQWCPVGGCCHRRRGACWCTWWRRRASCRACRCSRRQPSSGWWVRVHARWLAAADHRRHRRARSVSRRAACPRTSCTSVAPWWCWARSHYWVPRRSCAVRQCWISWMHGGSTRPPWRYTGSRAASGRGTCYSQSPSNWTEACRRSTMHRPACNSPECRNFKCIRCNN